MPDVDRLDLPSIELAWSEWARWSDIALDARVSGIRIPSQPGVYEVAQDGKAGRIHIGSASDLRYRIRQGLVRGIARHSSGSRIRVQEELPTLIVRWAETAWPKCAEELLHKRHIELHGSLPSQTKHT